jgi:hypothetical protein
MDIRAALLATVVTAPALAWDAHGHRTITLLAMDRFERSLTAPAAQPEGAEDGRAAAAVVPGELAWVFTASGRAQAAYQSGEPDRYRAIRSPYLRHENDPEHYFDVEDLRPVGLTLSTVPPLRYEFVKAVAAARAARPDDFPPINPKTDAARTMEWPGFLPYASVEHYFKLVASFRQVRVLESLGDAGRAEQLEAARANVLAHMGHLSHFVGDAAQPLHTTKHHHGWVGENPDGFTTNRGFHAYIDGTILGRHDLSYETLKASCTAERRVDRTDPFRDILAHIQRSYDYVRPLYQLQKTGDLEKEPGKAFISERLCDGAGMLAAMYLAAWEASAMSEQDARDFLRYDAFDKAAPDPMQAEEERLKKQQGGGGGGGGG